MLAGRASSIFARSCKRDITQLGGCRCSTRRHVLSVLAQFAAWWLGKYKTATSLQGQEIAIFRQMRYGWSKCWPWIFKMGVISPKFCIFWRKSFRTRRTFFDWLKFGRRASDCSLLARPAFPLVSSSTTQSCQFSSVTSLCTRFY